jgi:hypothetical protein
MTGGGYSITLPNVANYKNRIITIKRVTGGANVLTVATLSSETIDGAATYTGLTAQWDSVTVQSDGSNWYIIK